PLELRAAEGVGLFERDASEILTDLPDVQHADELDAIERDGFDPDRMGSVLHIARRGARRDAADALDGIQRGVDASDALGRAADRLAMITHIERTGRSPDWAGERGLADESALLLSRIREGESEKDATFGVTMSSPLRLSYTSINSYRRCPRCFYVSRMLGLEQAESPALAVGKAVHAALESFMRRWVDADSEGEEPPGAETLERLTRRAFYANWPTGIEVDHDQLGRALAQSRVFFDTMHDGAAHVLEIERTFDFPFVVDGVAHRVRGKIDRIDLAESTGGRRVIDYKTGHPSRELLTPDRSDLQLGIYAMGLAHLDGVGVDQTPDWSDGSVGEYWLLASGEVGSLPLASLDFARVRARIEDAVRGMLAGRFERGGRCSGDCEILDDAGPAGV
ncbi:MAG: PD-(D/E)XK nuclease family protein, partial [Planctomycetota bacterium]